VQLTPAPARPRPAGRSPCARR